jgi:alpha-mannosidase
MRITSAESTDLFVGDATRPLQVVRVRLIHSGSRADRLSVAVQGAAVSTPEPAVVTGLAPGEEHIVEVGVEVAAPVHPGSTRQIMVTATGQAATAQLPAELTVAEPGWVMWMVSHFHYDPVWWNTQGQFLQSRLYLPDEHGSLPETRTAFELVRLHLDAARRDPDYKFVLAEIDYLKPHFDAHPEDRADLLDFIKAGRIELVGGNYNEANTNLTCAESTIRNAVYGMAFQRDVLGGSPRTAWMLDAFGFDPGYPGLMAAAGLTESSWARGPFHQWGPSRLAGGHQMMQFATEFEWLSPDGTGLLTSYMANHYSAGWLAGHHATTLEQAEADAYRQFRELSAVAATRNVLLPVGGDHVIPSRWATAIHRDWNAKYVWPRFVTAVPSEFFAAVRAESGQRGTWLTPQTRDMNPVYTGKDVSYTDTKQGQRAAETAVLDGERLATLAWLAGAPYPIASLDRAWRLLVFGAHHDAITGTEGDQVYLDLVGGWREAWQRGDDARRDAIAHLAGLTDTASLPGARGTQPNVPEPLVVTVVNSLSMTRAGMATVALQLPAGWPGWLQLTDDAGARVPFLAEGAGRTDDGRLSAVTLTFRAEAVPGVGYRSYLVRPVDGDGEEGWQPMPAGSLPEIGNDALLVQADPGRGGTLRRVLHRRSRTDLLRAGGDGNELLLQPEHPTHPQFGEGPWLLCTAGPADGSSARPADVRAERCPVGSRLVAELDIEDLHVTQETLLWEGAHRVEFRTHVDGSIGQDRLLRASFPVNVPGGLPVFQTAVSAIGRPPGRVDIDVAEHPFTLDTPAAEWLAVGSTARIAVPGQLQAIGVAEVVCPPELRECARPLIAALAACGVTATCTVPDGPRYGYLELDSNLPDVRICLGGPEGNALSAAVLAAARPAASEALATQLAAPGRAARLWVRAARSRTDAFAAGADVRGLLDIPVLIVAADDMLAATAALISDLSDAVIEVGHAVGEASGGGGDMTALADRTVALLNRGTPSGLVTPEGTLTMALMRACSAWPCGVWIDEPKRTCPDGTSFGWQHWSHTFEYALAAGPGDWRSAGFAPAGLDYNHDLLTTVTSLHGGPLPACATLASITPDPATAGPHGASRGTAVALSALKPFGNPLAPGEQPDPADGVTVRLRNLAGAGPQRVRVTLHPGVTAARIAALCEDSTGAELPVRDETAVLEVPHSGMATAVLTPKAVARVTAAAQPPEPAQPVFARYWLHGKGPAPAGNMPVAVHLSAGQSDSATGPAASSELALDNGQAGTVRLTVACGPQPAAGTITLAVPAGLLLEPNGPVRYDLPPRGYQVSELTVRAPAGCPPGRRFLTASITEPSGQVVADSVLLTVGGPARPRLDTPLLEFAALHEVAEAARLAELDLSLAACELTLQPGQTAAIEALLTNRCASPVQAEAQLVSPHGSWQLVQPWTASVQVPPGATGTARFTVGAPATARRGEQWWAIVKVMYFGRVRYSDPVQVTIA